MIVRAVDGNNDWTFGKGKNDYVSANKAIEQDIQTRLQSFLGDCFFALDAGLDWFNLLGSKNQLALELAVRASILNTEGVTGIVNVVINLEPSTRRIDMKYTVNTIYTVVNASAVPITSSSSFLLTEAGDVLTTEQGAGIQAG